jgi:hypothetical protein
MYNSYNHQNLVYCPHELPTMFVVQWDELATFAYLTCDPSPRTKDLYDTGATDCMTWNLLWFH